MSAAPDPGSKRDLRFAGSQHCPICNGRDNDPRGQGVRCAGWFNEDRSWANCQRRESGHPNPSGDSWGHKLSGECSCGQSHGLGIETFKPNRPRAKLKSSAEKPAGSATVRYDYTDESGKVIRHVFSRPILSGGKDVYQKAADGGSLDGVANVPFNLPALVHAAPSEVIYVAEGEKCASALIALGFLATTSAMGAGKWVDAFGAYLANRHVVVFGDDDEPGRRHTEMVAASAEKHGARSTRVIDGGEAFEALGYGDPPPHCDIYDIIEATPPGVDPAEVVSRLAFEAPARNGTGGVFGVFAVADPPSSPVFFGSPIAVVEALRPVPPFNLKLLPSPIDAWVGDIADRMQCAIEFPAAAAIVALATVIGRRLTVRPKRHDHGWTIVPNLWGAGVGRPGVMKTPAMEEALKPLRALTAKAFEDHDTATKSFELAKKIDAAQEKATVGRLEKAAKKAERVPREELERIASEAESSQAKAPTLKRFIVNDGTTEKIGELLNENPRGLMIFRDEHIGWLRSMEKQAREMDRGFYLESWNGCNPFQVERIGRGSLKIDALCLSIFGGIQPGVLASYLRSALHGSGDDGLVARMQILVYPDQGRDFKIVDRPADREARDRADRVFETLDAMTPEAIGAQLDNFGGLPFLQFDDEAQEFFYGWWEMLETTKLRVGDLPAIESHLSKFKSLMPSLALILHAVEWADGGPGGPISLDSARRAAAWCALLEEHARRVYESATDGDVAPAQLIARRLAESLPEPFTASDVRRKGWSGLDTIEAAERALDILSQHNWIKGVESPGGTPGRPTTKYYRNPAIAEVAR